MRILLFGVMLLTPFVPAQSQSTFNLMPLPVKVQAGAGQLAIDSSFRVKIEGPNDPRVRKAVDRFSASLLTTTGIPFTGRLVNDSSAKLVIRVATRAKEFPELGEDESYTLEITDAGAVLNAPNSLPFRIRGPCGFHPRPTAFPVAWLAVGSWPSLHARGRSKTQPRCYGSGKDERAAPPPHGEPGVPDGEQEVSKAA